MSNLVHISGTAVMVWVTGPPKLPLIFSPALEIEANFAYQPLKKLLRTIYPSYEPVKG